MHSAHILTLLSVITFAARRITGDYINQQSLRGGSAVPEPIYIGSKWLLAFPWVPSYSGHYPHKNHFFGRAALGTTAEEQHAASFKAVAIFFFCLSLARLLVLLLLLMSANVHPNPVQVFPYSVRAGNVT